MSRKEIEEAVDGLVRLDESGPNAAYPNEEFYLVAKDDSGYADSPRGGFDTVRKVRDERKAWIFHAGELLGPSYRGKWESEWDAVRVM